jgi:DNA-binding IclR family transcriptional regulator
MVRSASRALEILEIVGTSRNGLKHVEIAQALNIPKSSLTKLLSSLLVKDYLTMDKASRTYAIGPAVLSLASSYLAGLDIVRIARPVIRDAMIRTGESASLMIRSGQEGLIVCKENSSHIVIARFSIGTRVPLYATAGGKAMLAFLPAEEVDRYISSVQLTRLTSTTITNPKDFRDELKKIRKRGLARCNGEQYEDLISIAAPVFGWDGRVVAAVGTPFPKIRSNAESEGMIEDVLRDASIEISRKLGLRRNSRFPDLSPEASSGIR